MVDEWWLAAMSLYVRTFGHGRPKTSRILVNNEQIENLIASQEESALALS